jgi:hypothetical protein
MELAVTGGGAVEQVDAWGNTQALAVDGGKVRIAVSSLPIYLRLAKGQEVAPPRIDFGPNLAAGAEFTYSGSSASDTAIRTLGGTVTNNYIRLNPYAVYQTGSNVLALGGSVLVTLIGLHELGGWGVLRSTLDSGFFEMWQPM